MDRKKSTLYLAGVSLVICFCLIACHKNSTSEPSPPSSPPQITSFAPATARGGASIVITGTNFNKSVNGNTVTINGHVATVTAVNSRGTELTVTVPLRAGSGPVAVTVNSKTATSASSFSYEWAYTSVTTLAGSGTGASGFADDPNGANVRFSKPAGIAADTAGNIYVVDQFNQRIRKITPTGATTTLAGSGVAGFADNTDAAQVKFNYPTGVAVDRNGNIYVADPPNNRIRKVAPNGATTTLAGSGISGFADSTNGAYVKFNNPYGVAVDDNGNVYVADQANNRIRKVAPSTGATTTLAGNGNSGWVDHTDPAQVKFSSPFGVALDIGGNVYVADVLNYRIRKVLPAGATTTLAGSSSGFEDNANGLNAKFSSPVSVIVDMGGNVYVADANNHRIRKVTATGAVSTLAGSGIRGLSNHATNPLAAQFSSPSGITIDKEGNLYVADRENNCIRKITLQ